MLRWMLSAVVHCMPDSRRKFIFGIHQRRMMMCAECRQLIFLESPKECPHCHAKIRVCEKCFGTGQIRVLTGGTMEHTIHGTMECPDCGGIGSLKAPDVEDDVEE